MNLVHFMPYLWITVAVLSLIIEAASLYYTAICFLPAAIITIALAFLNYPIYVQVLVFIIAAAAALLIRFTLLRNVLNRKKITPDMIVGNKAIVTETINYEVGTGKIKIYNKIYKAESYDENIVFEVGVMVTISAYREDDETFICE